MQDAFSRTLLRFGSDQIRLAMEAGQVVGWDWNLKTGRDVMFGDLKTMFGLSEDWHIGRVDDFRSRVHPDDQELVWRAVTEARESRAPYRATFRVIRSDGVVRWVAARGKFLYAEDGEPIRMVGTAVDITERARIEDSLQATKARLTAIIDSAMDAIIAIDDHEQVVVFNAAAETMFGCAAAEAIGAPLDRFIPERFRTAHRAHVRGYRDTGMTSRDMGGYSQLWALRSDGREFPIEASISKAAVEGHTLLTVVMRDVTERRRAEEAARRLASVVESCHDAVISIDCDARISSWNPSARRIFGFTAEEAIGMPITLLVPPELWSEEGQIVARINAGEVIDRYDTIRITKDGRRVNVSLTISPIRDFTGRIVGASKIAHEWTLAEQALRESEERFRLVANTAPVMIWMAGEDMLCNYVNSTWLEFTGRSTEEELGNGWADVVHEEDRNRCVETYNEAFRDRRPFQMEYRLRRHDGEYRWILDTGVPRFTPDGSFAGYIGSALDVTEHKRVEELLSGFSRRLIDAHEKESTRIARELHDDIGQRMALLSIELQRLQEAVPRATANAKALMDELLGHTNDLARDVQAMSHRLHSSKLDYLGIAAAAASLCRELSKQHKVEITFRCDGVPKDVPKDIALGLYRVLQEAISNAVKHAQVTEVAVVLQGHPDAIELVVVDTGVGFDPHAAIRGRGLGLTSMQERLSLVNGEIAIDSRRGAGTTIRARVPLKSVGNDAVVAG